MNVPLDTLAGRNDLVAQRHPDKRLVGFRTEVLHMLAAQNLSLTKAIGKHGRDVCSRLWSTVTIITGVSTAISATIGAGVTVLLKAGEL